MPDAFQFPDESPENKVADAAPEVEIEVVDDTPEKDRGRRPLEREVADPTDDEIESYSEGVQKRIKELTHARHDERRQREAIQRERQELEAFAQRLIAENNQLKTSVNAGSQAFAVTAKQKAESDLEMARKALKEAHEAFDTDAIVAAQEALSDAKMRFEAAKNFRPTALQPTQVQVQTRETQPQAPQQAAQPDEKSLRWQAKNQWFGATGFEEATTFALGVHQRLVSEKIDPRSDEYFERIDARMREKFPEVFGGASQTATSAATRRPSTVVAPASRSTGVQKIRLTATQVALAKKFGLTPQQYAAQVAKLENANG